MSETRSGTALLGHLHFLALLPILFSFLADQSQSIHLSSTLFPLKDSLQLAGQSYAPVLAILFFTTLPKGPTRFPLLKSTFRLSFVLFLIVVCGFWLATYSLNYLRLLCILYRSQDHVTRTKLVY